MAIFGETLRQARAYKGVTLKEAEQATRINRHHLAALEDENFAALPPLIYQRGIVRNYATFLDLDPNKVLTMFEEAHGTASGAASVPMAVKPLEMPNHFTPNFAIIAFLVVLSAIVFAWVYSVYRGPEETLPTPTMQTTVTPIVTSEAAAPISATATPTATPEGDQASASSPEASGEAVVAQTEVASRPMSEANARRTQVAEDRAAGVEPTERATQTPRTAANVAGNDDEQVDTADVEETPEATATPDAEATDAAATEEALAAEAADATQAAISANAVTVSFAPQAGIYLTVIADGVVVFDGNVTAGTEIGPFSAELFSVYTSDPATTLITNLDTGITFVMGSTSFNLQKT